VGRWVRRAIHQAPGLLPAVIRLCYEFDPGLVLGVEAAHGLAGAPGEVAGLLHWAQRWEAMRSASKCKEAMGGFAAVNLSGPLEGMWC